jgi:hypothetical protein
MAGASRRVSDLAGQLDSLDKAVSASRVKPEVARITLDSVRREIASLAEEGRQGRLTDVDRGCVQELGECSSELAARIAKASEGKS